jgi:hypothetical protein
MLHRLAEMWAKYAVRAALALGFIAFLALALAVTIHREFRDPPPAQQAPLAQRLAPSSSGSTLTHHETVLNRRGRRTCLRIAARHSYLEATSARVSSTGAVTITGHAGYEKCTNIPEQVEYLHRTPTVTFTLARDAVVRRVTNNPTIGEGPLAARALPRYLRTARANPGMTRATFFAYDGSRNAITRLIALYHP